MKKLLILLFAILATVSFSQTKYTITVNTSDNLKEVLDDLTVGYETFDRGILDSGVIYFSSYHSFTDKYLYQISYEQRNVISIFREIVTDERSGASYNGNNDCADAYRLCDNESFVGSSSDFNTQELNITNRGCLTTNEHQSTWYYFQIDNGGLLNMEIRPSNYPNNSSSNNGIADYDFAIWGPFSQLELIANCPPNVPPIRCSYSACRTPTGMGNGEGCIIGNNNQINQSYSYQYGSNSTENQSGNSWVSGINTINGEFYILMIDNWSQTDGEYELSWNGKATFRCPLLPVELVNFYGKNNGVDNILQWVTASEVDNDYFIIEQSIDLVNWSNIGLVNAVGNSINTNEYRYTVPYFNRNKNYYRLSQVDFNAHREYFKTILIDNSEMTKHAIKVINMLGQEVEDNYIGFLIIIFSDGTSMKTYNP
jgi:hypothetical protein